MNNIKFPVCVSFCHTYVMILIFCTVQLFIYVGSEVVSTNFAPSTCIFHFPCHSFHPALHPSVFFLWLLPPSLFRSTEQRATRG